MSRRAFVVVLDAVGAGELPDSADYGDGGADTLVHVDEAVGGLQLPVLGALGLGRIRRLRGVPAAAAPVLHGRLAPQGPGKDSTTGHWELMGVITPRPLPTYPGGFPAEVVAALERATGLRFCGNRPADGLAIITQLGEHNLRTGEVILYTSADSVLQLAAHDRALSEDDLRAACAAARDVMAGEHAVGRVIARPFTGRPGAFRRTAGRKDFSLRPPGRSYLEAVQASGVPVVAVGKVRDLFAGVGIDRAHPAPTNALALEQLAQLIGELEAGLVFANLIETDQLYGHRHDVQGFHDALRAIDAAVGSWLPLLGADDLLILTADHGVDPTMPHHDHTREHAPLLARFAGDGGRRHDGQLSDVGASTLAWLSGRRDDALPGRSFLDGAQRRP